MRERAGRLGREIETGTVFMNRADYLDPALCWTGVKETGRGGSLSIIGFHNLTRRNPTIQEGYSMSSANITANWSYPTAVKLGRGRIKELADACKSLGDEEAAARHRCCRALDGDHQERARHSRRCRPRPRDLRRCRSEPD